MEKCLMNLKTLKLSSVFIFSNYFIFIDGRTSLFDAWQTQRVRTSFSSQSCAICMNRNIVLDMISRSYSLHGIFSILLATVLLRSCCKSLPSYVIYSDSRSGKAFKISPTVERRVDVGPKYNVPHIFWRSIIQKSE